MTRSMTVFVFTVLIIDNKSLDEWREDVSLSLPEPFLLYPGGGCPIQDKETGMQVKQSFPSPWIESLIKQGSGISMHSKQNTNKGEQITYLDHDMVELSLLLPGRQVATLEKVALEEGSTPGQLIRELIRTFLAQQNSTRRDRHNPHDDLHPS